MKPKSVANIVCEPMVNIKNQSFSNVSSFTPFVFKGKVAISPDSTVRSVSILRYRSRAVVHP